MGIAAGACSGNGILLDITDPVHPKRLDAVSDPNYAFWHSANFANDGKSVLFTDEWGGGGVVFGHGAIVGPQPQHLLVLLSGRTVQVHRQVQTGQEQPQLRIAGMAALHIPTTLIRLRSSAVQPPI